VVEARIKINKSGKRKQKEKLGKKDLKKLVSLGYTAEQVCLVVEVN
jgi:hypothetical protein